MYLNSSIRRGLTIGGVSLLAVAGLVGWVRRDPPPTTAQPLISTTFPSASATPYPGTPVDGSRVVYGAAPFGPDTTPAYQPPAVVDPPPVTTVAAERPRTRYVTRTPRTRVVVKKRPLKNSALIVGGGAAGGAAIGALAGGGKGAGIGALAGGVGGLVYDRLTHKKKHVVVERR